MEPDTGQVQRLALRFANTVRQTMGDMIGGTYHFRDEDLRVEPFSHAKGTIAFIHFGGTLQGDCILVFSQQDVRKLFDVYCRKNGIASSGEGSLSVEELISEMINTSTGQLIPFLDREIDAISIMPPVIVSGTMTFPKVAAGSIRITGPTGTVTCVFTLNLMRQKIAETLRTVTDDLEKKTRLALTDSLTDLNNRTYFDTYYQQLAETSVLTRAAFSIMILDIDCLKKINDGSGHQVGDAIIKGAAQIIRCEVRLDDIPCRYGGDEFIVMLPGTIDVDAKRVAERIRKRLADMPYPGGAAPNHQHITMSIGIGQLERDESPQELFYRTDLALYTAKSDGRDRVVIAPPRDTATSETPHPRSKLHH